MSSLTKRIRFLQNVFLSDRIVVRRQYRKLLGRPLDLENPKGFHEKICWLRLNAFTPLHTYCADKVTAAAYVCSKVGPGFTVPRFFTTKTVDMLSRTSIPACQCVIKPNHASQTVAIVNDTASADWPEIRRKMATSLRKNFYWAMRETQYRYISPTLIVEELVDMAGVSPGEVNMYCLGGRVAFCLVFEPGAIIAGNRGQLVDRNFVSLAVTRQRHPTNQSPVPRPEDLTKMIEVAEALAAPFPLVRVDFIRGQNAFYVNELTFSPLAGYERFIPETFEMEMGERIPHLSLVTDWAAHLEAAKSFEKDVLPVSKSIC